MKRAPPAPCVYSNISLSPLELPNAAMGRRPICWLMPTGLSPLSSLKFSSGKRTRTGLPSRISNFVLMLLPTAHELVAGWSDDAVPQREELELGRRLSG